MPSEQRPGLNEEPTEASALEQLAEAREERSIGWAKSWARDLASEHGHLVAEHDDLDRQIGSILTPKADDLEQPHEREIQKGQRHGASSSLPGGWPRVQVSQLYEYLAPTPWGVELDKEEHVEAPKQHCVDGEAVTRQHRGGLAPEELGPRRPCPPPRRVDAVATKDCTEVGFSLADRWTISTVPAGTLGRTGRCGYLHRRRTRSRCQRRSVSGWTRASRGTGSQGADSVRRAGSVTGPQRWSGNLAPEQSYLTTEHGYFDSELSTVTPMKPEQAEDSDERQIQEGQRHGAVST